LYEKYFKIYFSCELCVLISHFIYMLNFYIQLADIDISKSAPIHLTLFNLNMKRLDYYFNKFSRKNTFSVFHLNVLTCICGNVGDNFTIMFAGRKAFQMTIRHRRGQSAPTRSQFHYKLAIKIPPLMFYLFH
jgi:hypothetical protein